MKLFKKKHKFTLTFDGETLKTSVKLGSDESLEVFIGFLNGLNHGQFYGNIKANLVNTKYPFLADMLIDPEDDDPIVDAEEVLGEVAQ